MNQPESSFHNEVFQQLRQNFQALIQGVQGIENRFH